jgi:aminopeptidase N
MDKANPPAILLSEYRVPAWLIDTVDLDFDLGETDTLVTAVLHVRRNPASADSAADLDLDGDGPVLVSLTIDGQSPADSAWTLTPDSLTLRGLPDAATVRIVSRIQPQLNTSLSGLYQSSGNFCTQCEAQGFRRITWFLDRPDVMARYSVRIAADAVRCPVLLSNGNRVDGGLLPDGRHWARWDDPWPKPSYLFALVAGNLLAVSDRFTTRSGRVVDLHIYVEPGNTDKCAHAMESLKRSMKWDEDVYGLEYDLDIFNIVAVADFNMGAMENKSLNIFNTKYILARPDTATDMDFLGIEAVVAHEYFHNWTGNRVTCRDWFQLSLKEGLTVFRDQQFSADMNSAPVKRIQDVARLRVGQFAEDSGPTAHPVRPESYIEINNFYTPTVYEKGAEVLRLYHTLLGPAGYRRGIDLYFSRHDGQAVTTDDFLAAMRDANPQAEIDWDLFRLWYSQAGTPVVQADGRFDAESGQYTLTLSQTVPATPGQPDKRPMLIPLALGLVGPDGQDLPLQLPGETDPTVGTRVICLTEARQQFRFQGLTAAPVPSLLRGFSAPVRLQFPYSDADLAFLMGRDSDAFNRWEAGQTLATRLILAMAADRAAGRAMQVPDAFVDAAARILARSGEDRALAALALALPLESYIGQQMAVVDVDGIHEARLLLRRTLGRRLREPLLSVYQACRENGPFEVSPDAIGRRSLKNAALSLLMIAGDAEAGRLCLEQFRTATAMTDAIQALMSIIDSDLPERADCIAGFAERWQGEALVMDKWFLLQALSIRTDTVQRVTALLDHPGFSIRNPNKVYSLIGGFAGNEARFHAADGSGYRFLADRVLQLDPLNPQVAARMLKNLARWRRYDSVRQDQARAALQRIAATPSLSRDVYEIASKSLAD